MTIMWTGQRAIPWILALATTPGLAALAGEGATAARSLTVQATGVRQGEPGTRYFNVEGVKKERHASFGVLAFEWPRGGDPPASVETMSLRLVQSVARFSQDGKVRYFLAEPARAGADALSGLKFEPGSPGGVPKDAFKALHPLATGTFAKAETGRADTITLKPDEAGRRLLGDRIRSGGTILIVAVPDDETVAATYFGAEAEPAENRPRLGLDTGPAK